jgi:hypothetical protein
VLRTASNDAATDEVERIDRRMLGLESKGFGSEVSVALAYCFWLAV